MDRLPLAVLVLSLASLSAVAAEPVNTSDSKAAVNTSQADEYNAIVKEIDFLERQREQEIVRHQQELAELKQTRRYSHNHLPGSMMHWQLNLAKTMHEAAQASELSVAVIDDKLSSLKTQLAD